MAAVLKRGAATHRALDRRLWQFRPYCKVEHWPSRLGCVAKQPILSSDDEGPDRTLGGVVVGK